MQNYKIFRRWLKASFQQVQIDYLFFFNAAFFIKKKDINAPRNASNDDNRMMFL
jgi:hypothetical protein